MKSSDPQIDGVYAWEDSWWGWNRSVIAFDESKLWIKRACRQYGVKAPRVKRHYSKVLSWSTPEDNLISMQNSGGLNVPISLHEASHHIVWHLFGEKPQDHGPTFLGIYLDLLECAKVASRKALIASLKDFDLTWKSPRRITR